MKGKERERMMKKFYDEIDQPRLLPDDMKEISIRYCESSMTYRLNNKWKEYEDISEVLDDTVNNALKKKVDKDTEIEVEPVMKGEKIKELIITAKKKGVTEQKKVKAIVDRTMNPAYSKRFSNYLEGTLQLRNVDEGMFTFLQDQLSIAEKRFSHVIDLREKDKAIDIDMTSQKEIEKIAKNMQKEFGGELKMDYKLHTRDKQTQKELHRLTATVILPDVKKGDHIESGDQVYKVVAIMGNKMKVSDLDTGKNKMMSLKDEHKILKKEKAIVVQINPDIKVIDPETYQMTKIILKDKKNVKKIRMNQKLDVVRSKKRLYSVKK
ncbi:MAG: NMD3-related protein [Candidatus Woesearchaeota archaeon]